MASAGVSEIACCGIFLFGIGAISGFYILTIYNGLITLRNNTEKSWSNVDVVLKQRSDLIPNLVEMVKGYMKHEKETLERVTKLRAEIMAYESPAKKAKASLALSDALKTVFAVAENYPALKASDNFLKLQEQLSSMENQIADRREFYNHAVLLYNNRIASLPDLIIAKVAGFDKREYFRAAEEDKGPVDVKLEQ